ncbi:GTP-binding protein [Streptococcus pneumoniae]|nr:GTP-binding protein [Streptococcus pneumoniae]
MEEILCIGCGATIQTTDKAGLGFTPQSALEKGLETGEVYCQRCFRLRHYNEITDVQLTNDDFLKLLHEVGDSDALVVNVIDTLILMDLSSQVYHVSSRAMMSSW